MRTAARDLQRRYPRRRDLRQLPDRPLFPLPNEWLGVSVEDNARTLRIDHLRQTPAALRFVSFEPLAGISRQPRSRAASPGRSSEAKAGPGARRILVDWVHAILDRLLRPERRLLLQAVGRPATRRAPDSLLDGALYDTIPERLDDGSYFIPLLTDNHNLHAAVLRMEAFLDECRSDAPVRAESRV